MGIVSECCVFCGYARILRLVGGVSKIRGGWNNRCEGMFRVLDSFVQFRHRFEGGRQYS